MYLSLFTGLAFFFPFPVFGVSVHISFTPSNTMLQWRSNAFTRAKSLRLFLQLISTCVLFFTASVRTDRGPVLNSSISFASNSSCVISDFGLAKDLQQNTKHLTYEHERRRPLAPINLNLRHCCDSEIPNVLYPRNPKNGSTESLSRTALNPSNTSPMNRRGQKNHDESVFFSSSEETSCKRAVFFARELVAEMAAVAMVSPLLQRTLSNPTVSVPVHVPHKHVQQLQFKLES